MPREVHLIISDLTDAFLTELGFKLVDGSEEIDLEKP